MEGQMPSQKHALSFYHLNCYENMVLNGSPKRFMCEVSNASSITPTRRVCLPSASQLTQDCETRSAVCFEGKNIRSSVFQCSYSVLYHKIIESMGKRFMIMKKK